MMGSMGGMAFGSQLGQGLAQLAGEVLTSTDVGLPLGPVGTAALMPLSISEFGSRSEPAGGPGAAVPGDPGGGAPPAVRAVSPGCATGSLALITDYASAISVDFSAVEQLASSIDPNDPASIEAALRPGHVRADDHPGPAGARWPSSRRCSRWSRAGWTPWSPTRSATGCPARPRCARPCVAAGPPAARPSRPSRP